MKNNMLILGAMVFATLIMFAIPSAGLLTIYPAQSNTTYIGYNITISATGGTNGALYQWVSSGSCPGFNQALAGTTNAFNYTPTGVSLNCQFTASDNQGDNPGISNTILILWNTDANAGNFGSAPDLVKNNIPWFFPFISLVLLLMVDYTLGIKKGIDSKMNFLASAIAFTILCYIEVLGNLSTTNFFFLFEFIMVIALLLMTLFAKRD